MLLDYQTHLNVSGGVDLVDKIRSFAVSKGWVQEEWRSGYDWLEDPEENGHYIWTASSNCCYLCLSSSGYGSTSLIIGIAITHSSIGDGEDYLHISVKTSTTYSAYNSLHPFCQNVLSPNSLVYNRERYSGMHLGTANIDRIWIFGDSKYIAMIADMDGTFCNALHFGQLEMFESSPTNGAMYGFTYQYYGGEAFTWQDHMTEDSRGEFGVPWWPSVYSLYLQQRQSSMDICWDDVDADGTTSINSGIPYTTIGCNIYLPYSGPGALQNVRPYQYYCNDLYGRETNILVTLPNLIPAINLNAFSNKRTMLKPIYFKVSSIDSSMVPICKGNYYFMMFSGLEIGETLTYGTEQYLVFPLSGITCPYGVAFRIA